MNWNSQEAFDNAKIDFQETEWAECAIKPVTWNDCDEIAQVKKLTHESHMCCVRTSVFVPKIHGQRPHQPLYLVLYHHGPESTRTRNVWCNYEIIKGAYLTNLTDHYMSIYFSHLYCRTICLKTENLSSLYRGKSLNGIS
jgi:hypothetical protein